MTMRRFTWILATLLGLLAGSALMPASWVLAAPGDGYGPGTCGGDTTRACEATDSALTVAVEAILVAATGYSTGAGTVDATTLRSVLATNSPGAAVLSDIDPGAGTDTQATIALRLAKTGGSALVGAGGDGDPMPVSDDGGSITVDNAYFSTIDADTSTLAGTVTANRVAVNLITGVTGVYSNAGGLGGGTQRVVEAGFPATAALYDPDQIDAVMFAAADARRSITCQVVGTTQVLVREGAATGGACCHRFNGGTLANDGTGQWFQVTSVSAVYVYDVAGAGNADIACTIEANP